MRIRGYDLCDVQNSLMLDTLLVNDCFSVPCQQDGICIPLSYGFQCVCPPGYQGSLCQTEVDPCLSSPCLNDGFCSKQGSLLKRCLVLIGWILTLVLLSQHSYAIMNQLKSPKSP